MNTKGNPTTIDGDTAVLVALYKGQPYSIFIDREDVARVTQFTWSIQRKKHLFYAISRINGKLTSLHHFVFGAPPVGFVTDHRDTNGLNNCKRNLRYLTRGVNAFRTAKHVGTHGGRRARYSQPVSTWQRPGCTTWRVRIGAKYIGSFANREEAVNAVTIHLQGAT